VRFPLSRCSRSLLFAPLVANDDFLVLQGRIIRGGAALVLHADRRALGDQFAGIEVATRRPRSAAASFVALSTFTSAPLSMIPQDLEIDAACRPVSGVRPVSSLADCRTIRPTT
jgi:hypothetical protein